MQILTWSHERNTATYVSIKHHNTQATLGENNPNKNHAELSERCRSKQHQRVIVLSFLPQLLRYSYFILRNDYLHLK